MQSLKLDCSSQNPTLKASARMSGAGVNCGTGLIKLFAYVHDQIPFSSWLPPTRISAFPLNFLFSKAPYKRCPKQPCWTLLVVCDLWNLVTQGFDLFPLVYLVWFVQTPLLWILSGTPHANHKIAETRLIKAQQMQLSRILAVSRKLLEHAERKSEKILEVKAQKLTVDRKEVPVTVQVRLGISPEDWVRL